MVAHSDSTVHPVRVTYAPLRDHLSGETEPLRLSFGDIEAIVGPLPPSARKFRQWWENSRSHSQARAWLDAGYRVAQVDIVGEVLWFAPDRGPHGSVVTAETPMFDAPGDVAPGNSDEQKRAERAMIAALSADLGVALAPRSITLPSGNRLAVDGMSDDPLIYCEAWAHQGPPKSAQRAKVAKDLLKLTFLASVAPTPPRLILLFSDKAACAPFRSRSWIADVIAASHVDVMVVDLPADVRDAVLAAQRRQYR
jgi:hypothetical protein